MSTLLTAQHQEIIANHRSRTAALREAHEEVQGLAAYDIFHSGVLIEPSHAASTQLTRAALSIELGAKYVRETIRVLAKETFIAVGLDTTPLQKDDEAARTVRSTLILDALDPTRIADQDDSEQHIRNVLEILALGEAILRIPQHYEEDYAIPPVDVATEPEREIYVTIGNDRTNGVVNFFYDRPLRHNSLLRPPHILTLGNAALRNIRVS